MSAIREVLAIFRVDVLGVEKLAAADKGMKKLTGAFQDFMGALAGGAIVLGLKNFVQGQVDLATGLDQTARILGVTTDELQQFHLAAELSNTSVEAIDSALRFLNRTIGSEGGHGIGAKGAKELETLGIALRDAGGKSRPVIDVFADLADKLKETGDQGKATEIAMQVLGRGGARSLPLLMQGGEALRAKFAELKKLGGGISPEAIAAARKLQIEEVRLKVATQSLSSQFMEGLSPALSRGIERLVELSVSFKNMTKHTTFFQTFPLFVYAGGIAAGIFGVVKAVKALSFALGEVGYSTPIIAALTVALLALYFVFDDIYALFNGGGSIIGQVLDSMFGKGYSTELVKDLKQQYYDLIDLFKKGDYRPFFDGVRDGARECFKEMVKLAQIAKFVVHLGGAAVDVATSAIVGDGSDRSEVLSKNDLEQHPGVRGAIFDSLAGIGRGLTARASAVGGALSDAKNTIGNDTMNYGGNAAEKRRRDAAAAAADTGKTNAALANSPNAGLPPPPMPSNVHVGALHVHLPNVRDADKVPAALQREFDKITTQNNNAFGAVGGT